VDGSLPRNKACASQVSETRRETRRAWRSIDFT